MAIDQADNIYVQDSGLIRRIDSSANVSTLAGGGSGDGYARNAGASANGMWADNEGNVYLAGSTWVRRMSATTNITTVAGTFTGPANGYTNGPGNLARFYGANNICGSQGCLFVTDTQNQRIRQIAFNPQSQIVPPSNLSIATYPGVTINGTVGRTYQIQSSPDMSTWKPAATVLLNSTPYLWFDQSGGGVAKKFYRAVMLP